MKTIKRKIPKKNKALMGVMVLSMGLFTFAPGAVFANSVYVAANSTYSASSSSATSSSNANQNSNNDSIKTSVSQANSKNSEMQQKIASSVSKSKANSSSSSSTQQSGSSQSSKLSDTATPSPYSSMANNYGSGVSTSVNPQTGQLSVGINALSLLGNNSSSSVDISLTNSGTNGGGSLIQNGPWSLSLPFINTAANQIFLGGGENYYMQDNDTQVSITATGTTYTAEEYSLLGNMGYNYVMLNFPTNKLFTINVTQGATTTAGSYTTTTISNIQYVLLNQDGSGYYFNSSGQLVATIAPCGNGIIYNYTGDQLSSITDAFGDNISVGEVNNVATFTLANGEYSTINLANSNNIIITDINSHNTVVATTPASNNTPENITVTYPSASTQEFIYSSSSNQEIAYSFNGTTNYWTPVITEIDNPNNNSTAQTITAPTSDTALTSLTEDETVINYSYNYTVTSASSTGINTFTITPSTNGNSNDYAGFNLVPQYDPTLGDPLMMYSNSHASAVNNYYYATTQEVCSLAPGQSLTSATPITTTYTVYNGYQLPIESISYDDTTPTPTPTEISQSGTYYQGQEPNNGQFVEYSNLKPNYNLPYISWSTTYNGSTTRTEESEYAYNKFNQPLTINEYASATSSPTLTPSGTPIISTSYTYADTAGTGILDGLLPTNSGLPATETVAYLQSNGTTQNIYETYTNSTYTNNPIVTAYYTSNILKSYTNPSSTASASGSTTSYVSTTSNDIFGRPLVSANYISSTSTAKGGAITANNNGSSTSTAYEQTILSNGDIGIQMTTSYYNNISGSGTPVYSTSQTVDQENGEIASSTDQFGGTTTYTYSNNNNTIEVQSPDGETVTENIIKGKGSNEIIYTYSTGEVVTNYLDGFGNTVEETISYPNEPTMTSYQINNAMETYSISNEGALEETIRDAQGRTSQTISYLPNNTNPSQIVDYTYNNAVTSTTYPTAAYSVSESLADSLGSSAKLYPISTTYYDDNKNVVASINQNGETTTTATSNALGQTENSNLSGVTSSGTAIPISSTSYLYNADGTVSSSTTGFPSIAAGNLEETTNYTYNVPGSPSYTSTSFEGLLNALGISTDSSVSNSTLTSDNYTYDGLGELTSINDHLGKTESYLYSYSGNGMTTTETTFQGSKIVSTYNSNGQLTDMTVSGGTTGTADYSYQYYKGTDLTMDAGQLETITLSNNGTQTDQISYTYDNYGMVNEITETDHSGSGAATKSMTYTYGPLSSSDSTPVLQSSTDFAGITTAYTYYGANQETVGSNSYYVLPTDIETAQSSQAYIAYQYLSYQAGGSGVFGNDAFIYFGGSATPYQTTEGTATSTTSPQTPVLTTITNYSSLEGIKGKTMQIASVGTYKDTASDPATVTVGNSPDSITASGTLIDGTAYTYYTADSVNAGTGSAYEIGNIYQEEETTGLSASDYSNCTVQPTALDINNIRQYQYNQFGNLIEEDVYAVGTIATDGVPFMNTAVTPVQKTTYTYNTNNDMVTQNIYLNGSKTASGSESYSYNQGSDPTGTVNGSYVTDQVANIAVTGTLPGIPANTTKVVVTRDATGYNVASIAFNNGTTPIETQAYAYNNQNQLTSFEQYEGAASGSPAISYSYGYNALGLRAYKTDNLANS